MTRLNNLLDLPRDRDHNGRFGGREVELLYLRRAREISNYGVGNHDRVVRYFGPPKVSTRSLKVPIIVKGKPPSFTIFPTASSADP